jgi:uncharacterized protein YecT (DUF1311 family)
MKRVCMVLLLVCFSGCQQPIQNKSSAMTAPADAGLTSDAELRRLTVTLDAAKNQTDMNLASWNISKFWDARLASVEKRLEDKLDKQHFKQFTESSGRWRRYRTSEVKFDSDVFSGGSIRPLIANESYAQITQDRVTELETVLVDSHLETQ